MIETEKRLFREANYEHVGIYIKNTSLLHNENGPALIVPGTGFKGYFIYGKCHRVDGPAKVWTNYPPEYYLNDIYYKDIKSDEEWLIKQIIE
jgi:hypothetical protein